MVKIGKYDYMKSTRKDKKLMVIVDGKKIHFGGDPRKGIQHYKDKTGIWKELDHLDKKRRKNYLTRAKGIRNKEGELTYTNPLSPNYHAIRILWPE